MITRKRKRRITKYERRIKENKIARLHYRKEVQKALRTLSALHNLDTQRVDRDISNAAGTRAFTMGQRGRGHASSALHSLHRLLTEL